jgi:hypothetical protein
MNSFFAAIVLIIIWVLSVIAIAVPGLLIGLVVGHLFSRSLRHTRRVSNDAFFGGIGFAGGYLGSLFRDVNFQHNGIVGCSASFLLVVLYELYASRQTSRNRVRALDSQPKS